MGERKFGERYNDTTMMFEVWWDDDTPDVILLELPFNVDTVRFSRKEAKAMHDALDDFLCFRTGD